MYSTPLRAFAVVVAFTARHVLAAELSVSTPVLVQCQNATIQISGGQPSYLVSVVPSDDPCAESLIAIPQTTSTSVQFMVSIPSGTSVEMVADSADGQETWSGTVIVQPGTDSSCLSKTSSVSSSSSSASKSLSSSASSLVSAAAASSTSGSSSSSSVSANSGSADPWSAPPPAVQSGTIGSSDGPVNVGSNPNGTSSTTSGGVPRAALSVGSLIASAFFVAIASQL